MFSRLPLILARLGTVDILFHLGDYAIDAEKISAAMGGVPFFAVRGNNDVGSECPRSRVERVEDVRIMLVHGDAYYNLYHLTNAAKEQRCAAVLFGHTHVPLLQADGDLLIVNPGSMSLPRRGSRPSCALLEADGKDINIRMITL
jgi:putative phosphoesterase